MLQGTYKIKALRMQRFSVSKTFSQIINKLLGMFVVVMYGYFTLIYDEKPLVRLG